MAVLKVMAGGWVKDRYIPLGEETGEASAAGGGHGGDNVRAVAVDNGFMYWGRVFP